MSSIHHFNPLSLKSAWDLVYPEQNPDVREILRNLIGCFEDWELEQTGKTGKIKTPYILTRIRQIIDNHFRPVPLVSYFLRKKSN